jgi:hypothetical protein
MSHIPEEAWLALFLLASIAKEKHAELVAFADLIVQPENYRMSRQSLGSRAEVGKRLGRSERTLRNRESGHIRIRREAALAMMALLLIARPI